MRYLGLDWNATRALAVLGPLNDYPLPVPLEPPAAELPLLLSLERSQPELGGAAVRLCRQRPHAVCRGFLPALGTPSPTWKAGRATLDAAAVTTHVWKHLSAVCNDSRGVIV